MAAPSSRVEPVFERPPEERVSFLAVVNFILRNIGLILVAGIVVGGLLAIRAASEPPRYVATASFATEGESPGRLFGVVLPGGGGRPVDFYVELIKSPAILGPLVETRFEIAPDRPQRTLIEHFGNTRQSPLAAKEQAIEAVGSRMRTKVSPAGIVTIQVTAEHPHLAAGIARALLTQVELFNSGTRRSRSTAERRFAEQRLQEIGAEVRLVENRLRYFLERNRDISLSPALILERERIAEELAVRRALYSTVLQAVERAKTDEVRDSPVITVINQPTLPSRPAPGNTVTYGILGFFLGALVAVLIAMIREYFARIPGETSPEATEFTTWRTRASSRLFRPVRSSAAALFSWRNRSTYG